MQIFYKNPTIYYYAFLTYFDLNSRLAISCNIFFSEKKNHNLTCLVFGIEYYITT